MLPFQFVRKYGVSSFNSSKPIPLYGAPSSSSGPGNSESPNSEAFELSFAMLKVKDFLEPACSLD